MSLSPAVIDAMVANGATVEMMAAVMKAELVEIAKRQEVRQLPRLGSSARSDALKAELEAAKRRLAEIDDTLEETELSAHKEAAAFWFRRFFTTLGIANAGAFAAMASGVLQADKPGEIAPFAAPAMIHFTWGLLWAGAIPFFLWLRAQTDEWIHPAFRGHPSEFNLYIVVNIASRIAVPLATLGSVTSFCSGLFTALGSLQSMPK